MRASRTAADQPVLAEGLPAGGHTGKKGRYEELSLGSWSIYCALCGSPPNQVSVTLSDFKIQASQTTFLTGTTYHFIVTNTGYTSHEFMMMQLTMAGQMSMGQRDQMALSHIERNQLPPGAFKRFDFIFPATATSERLEFACHLTGHYEMGMHLPILVKQG